MYKALTHLGIATTILAATLMPLAAHAQLGARIQRLQQETGQAAGIDSQRDVRDIVASVIRIALSILGVVFILLIIYAGYNWMTAQGDEKQVQEAKRMIRNAIIGVAIILLSRAITSFVFDTWLQAK